MCYGIRILSTFHLATQIICIQNLICPKNAKKTMFGHYFWNALHECGMLFHKCGILFHECGMHFRAISNVAIFYKYLL